MNTSGIFTVARGTVQLPYSAYIPSLCSSGTCLIFGHGLGATNPAEKNHLNDEWSNLVTSIAQSIEFPTITYTARGHGESQGWQSTAETDPEQFTWRRLADDMNDIILAYSFSTYIAAGSSMGSATALFAAIKYPENVRAVIMVRPPTAWDERRNRRKNLLSGAKRLKEEETSTMHHNVLHGTAYSDLPSPLDEKHEYEKVQCPVLILTIEGDDAHPVSTANTLHSLLPSSELVVSVDRATARRAWPIIIKNFLEQFQFPK